MDANQCPINWNNILLTEPTELTSDIPDSSNYNTFGVHCNGDNDGYINLSVTGAVPPYTYSWTGPNSYTSSQDNISGLEAGIYNLIVTDANLCPTSEAVEITEPDLLVSSYDTSAYNNYAVSCNGLTDGSINLTVNDGVPSYNYLWVGPNGYSSFQANIFGLEAGTYNVTVTDLNLCETSQTVVITEPPVFVGATFGSDQTICEDEILNIISALSPASGGNPPYTYDWEIDDGTGFTSFSNNNLTWYQPQLLPDTTVYKIIHSDSFQCNTFTQVVTIVVNPLPVEYQITGDTIVCSNQSNANYTLTTTPQNYRYEWFLDPNDGTIIGTNESRNCLINWPSNPGAIVNLEVDVWIDETGCHIPAFTATSIEITNNEAPSICTVELKPSSTILACSDSSAGVHWQWGYDVIATGISTDLPGATLQYVQLSSVPDTNIYRYWVDTYYNYPNGSCTTRSYYNAPPLPLTLEDINTNNFIIYPNPMNDFINFSYTSSNEVEVEVIDLLGRKVACDIDYKNRFIRFNNLRPGIYMLVVKSNRKEFIKKFIKQ